MMVDAPKHPVSPEDRHLTCQEEVDAPLQLILERATKHGWGTFETISAMEEVLRHLRVMYADHPHPNENPTSSNEGHAFLHGRGGAEKP
jgi:hypothetical protein